MMVLKSCKGSSCTHPWNVLHPQGNVASLTDSLRASYDAFYDEQPKVTFTKCELGYIKESEGPMNVNIYGEEWKDVPTSFRYQGGFSLWA
jgi:hypothetical protein